MACCLQRLLQRLDLGDLALQLLVGGFQLGAGLLGAAPPRVDALQLLLHAQQLGLQRRRLVARARSQQRALGVQLLPAAQRLQRLRRLAQALVRRGQRMEVHAAHAQARAGLRAGRSLQLLRRPRPSGRGPSAARPGPRAAWRARRARWCRPACWLARSTSSAPSVTSPACSAASASVSKCAFIGPRPSLSAGSASSRRTSGSASAGAVQVGQADDAVDGEHAEQPRVVQPRRSAPALLAGSSAPGGSRPAGSARAPGCSTAPRRSRWLLPAPASRSAWYM